MNKLFIARETERLRTASLQLVIELDLLLESNQLALLFARSDPKLRPLAIRAHAIRVDLQRLAGEAKNLRDFITNTNTAGPFAVDPSDSGKRA